MLQMRTENALAAFYRYLETEELLSGEALTVDYLDLFDEGALSTLSSPWRTHKMSLY